MLDESPQEAAKRVIQDQENKKLSLEDLVLDSRGEVVKELQFALDEKGPIFKAIQNALAKEDQKADEAKAKKIYRLQQETKIKIKEVLGSGEEEKLFLEMEKYQQRKADLQEEDIPELKEWRYTDQALQEEDMEDEPVLFKPNFLTKGDVHFLVGKAGVGKSYLATQLALCLKSGRDFLGMCPSEKQKVAYLSFEDTQSRFLKRVKSIGESTSGEMSLFTGLTAIGAIEKGGLQITTQGRQLAKKVQESGCEILIIDTYAQAFLLDDGDNGSAQKVGNYLKKTFPGMTILVLHHPRKTEEFKKVEEITVDTVRGASAIVGYARSVFYLHREEKGYFLISLKSNYGQPFPDYQPRMLLSPEMGTALGKQVFRGFAKAGKSANFAGTEAHS